MIRTGKGADSMNTCPVVSLIPPSVRCSEAPPAHQCDGGQPQQRHPGGHVGASIAAHCGVPVPVSLPLTHHCESSARLDGEPVTLLSLGKKKSKKNSGSCQRKLLLFFLFFQSNRHTNNHQDHYVFQFQKKHHEFNEKSVLLLRCSIMWTHRNKHKRVQASLVIMSAGMLP